MKSSLEIITKEKNVYGRMFHESQVSSFKTNQNLLLLQKLEQVVPLSVVSEFSLLERKVEKF